MTGYPAHEAPRAPDWPALLPRLDGPYAPATPASCAKDPQALESFRRRGAHESLPAAPQTLAGFIAGETQRLAAAIICRRHCVIEKIYRLARLPSPVADADVKRAMRRVFAAVVGRPPEENRHAP